MINKQRLEQVFLDMLHINSPSKHERELADYVSAKLLSLGFEVEEDDAGAKIGGSAGNIIAFKPATVQGARGLFFCCHMDTVEPTDKLKIVADGGVIRSDGSTILGADDKSGIAAIIEGLTSVVERGVPHGDIQILFDVAEEIGLLGAKSMDHGKIKADLGYVLDTGKPAGGITVSAPSHENMSVEITGKAAHAGIEPEKGVSAIVAAGSAIAKMKLGRIDDETTANVGRIEGGKAHNIIPDRVTVKAEARSRSEEKLASQVQHMTRLFEEEAAKIGASAAVEVEREYASYRWTPEDEVVKLATAAARRVGINPEFQEGGGGSDANIFNSMGMPAVLIGLGYEGPHSSSEHIAVRDLALAAQLVAAIIGVAAEPEE